jgi:prepilin peptidase CpaA
MTSAKASYPETLLSFSFPQPVIAAVLLALVSIAAGYDVRYGRIPNWLTAAGVILGLLLNTILDSVWNGLKFSLAGFILALSVYFILYVVRAMGGGDVKLMAAIGALMGWRNWIAIFLITALIGAVAALLLVALRGRLRKTLWNVAFILNELKSGRPAYAKNEELDVRSAKGLGLPHGAVIAAGTLVFLAMSVRQYLGR